MNRIFSIGRASCALDKRTVMLCAASLFIFGTFLGCAVYRLLGIGESELYDNLIERYFLALFYKCASPADVIRVAADCVLHEIWIFAAVFFAGFTLFAPIISAAALLYRGLLFGFAVTMLQFSTRIGLLLDSIVYLCAAFAVSILLALLSTEAIFFYFPERHPVIKSRRTLNYVLIFLRICALVAANILFMLFLIYVYI